MPTKQQWPEIIASEYQCVTDKTWEALDLREALQQKYILELEATIRSTH